MSKPGIICLLLLAGLFLLSAACGKNDFIAVRVPESELPPICGDVAVKPLDQPVRSPGKQELRFEITNNGDRGIEFTSRGHAAGTSFALMKLVDGAWQYRRPKNVVTSDSWPSLLLPGESRTVNVYPYTSVGRLGKGLYRFCCFCAFEGEAAVCSYYEFEIS